jgi:hypothetical protein
LISSHATFTSAATGKYKHDPIAYLTDVIGLALRDDSNQAGSISTVRISDFNLSESESRIADASLLERIHFNANPAADALLHSIGATGKDDRQFPSDAAYDAAVKSELQIFWLS